VSTRTDTDLVAARDGTVISSRQVVRDVTEQLAFATREANLAASVATLRQWASDARGTSVTSGNAVATLQVVVNRLGVFFDQFADLLQQSGRG